MPKKNPEEKLIGAHVMDQNHDEINPQRFYHLDLNVVLRSEENLRNPHVRSTAYFSMEFGLAPSVYNTYQSQKTLSILNKKRDFEVFSNLRHMDYYHTVSIDTLVDIPIYSGGLGVLAGDTLKSSADLKLPLLGVGILWNKGYFDQRFCFHFGQMPGEFNWEPSSYPGLIKLDQTIDVPIGKISVSFHLWKYYVPSFDHTHVIPLLLLDSNHEANPDWAKKLTSQLYNSESIWWKIVQRKILGVGGMRAIKALGYSMDLYHLNEGHAAFAYLENPEAKFAYTCHT
ncbi:MAG: hypothetical protein AABZ14_02930, partial [Candidatus Margulisiibacteriota bacterium]